MINILTGKVLERKLSGRDLSHSFFFVLEVHPDHLHAVQLSEIDEPDPETYPGLQTGFSRPDLSEEAFKRASTQTAVRFEIVGNEIRDRLGTTLTLWDGERKPYRYC